VRESQHWYIGLIFLSKTYKYRKSYTGPEGAIVGWSPPPVWPVWGYNVRLTETDRPAARTKSPSGRRKWPSARYQRPLSVARQNQPTDRSSHTKSPPGCRTRPSVSVVGVITRTNHRSRPTADVAGVKTRTTPKSRPTADVTGVKIRTTPRSRPCTSEPTCIGRWWPLRCDRTRDKRNGGTRAYFLNDQTNAERVAPRALAVPGRPCT